MMKRLAQNWRKLFINGGQKVWMFWRAFYEVINEEMHKLKLDKYFSDLREISVLGKSSHFVNWLLHNTWLILWSHEALNNFWINKRLYCIVLWDHYKGWEWEYQLHFYH
jgi:hypothetical protein